MLRQEIRAFVRAGVDALTQTTRFNSGRITEFNSSRDNEYPFVWSEPLTCKGNIWNVILNIAKKDAAGSKPEEYETIVDECDLIAQKLMINYRIQLTGFDKLAIDPENISRDPFYHRHADDTSGIILTFEIQDFDPTNVC